MIKKQQRPIGGNINYRKVAGYKVKIQMSIVFLYTSNEQMGFEIRNTMPFTLAPQK